MIQNTSIYKKIYPYGCKTELKELLSVAWPIGIESLLQYLIIVESLGFSGHLGKDALDAVQLTTTIINVLGFSVITGMCTALETLLPQTFCTNKQNFSLTIQRGTIIISLACIMISTLFINMEHILILIGQRRTVARLGGQYAMILIAGFPGNAYILVLQRYLISQSIVMPGVILEIIGNVLNIGYHSLFIIGFNWGVRGAGIAVSATYWSLVLLYLLFIRYTGLYKDTWSGISKKCLTEWNTFLKLAVPGIFMIALQWCGVEMSVIICGFLDEVQLAAHTIVFQIYFVIFTVPLGIAVGACVKVGYSLSVGNHKKAMTTSRVAASITVLVVVVVAVTLLALRYVLPKAFTDNVEIVELSSKLFPLLALYSLFDFVAITLQGVLRGVGQQRFAAIFTLVSYYVIGLPLSITLTLYTSLKVAGAWWAMIISSVFQCVVYFIKLERLSWEEESIKAQERAGVRRSLNYQAVYIGDHIQEGKTYLSEHDFQELFQNNEDTLSMGKDYQELISEEKTKKDIDVEFTFILKRRACLLLSFLVILAASILLKYSLDGKLWIRYQQCSLNGTLYNETSGRLYSCR
ncbi:TC.MATE [Mytilus coruscus]|uniref:Multidrug and toxin extrusion protein n=1 Tax=Mytilus coruscus TaxID=42192 RepID=A0A6J8AYF6_MYTCO|nr:TC.MATE [Mytilus coruscus]